MAVVGITYDEGNKKDLGYKSVDIAYNELKDEKIFNSGNFVKDWFDHLKWMIQTELNNREIIMHSSSVDNFIMDGAPYDSAYLKIEDDGKKTSLVYDYDGEHTGIELFVAKDTQPTWEELKEICK